MSKYRKFYYSAGYVGTDTEVAMKFADDTTEEEIEDIFKDWVQEQDSREFYHEEISEEEAEDMGIEDEF